MPDARAANVYAGFQYTDAPAAMAWLERALGFEKVVAYPNPDGSIAHAVMRLGDGMIMLGSARKNPFGFTTPREAGGITSGMYLFVPDLDAHYARTKAAGAEMVYELRNTEYGSREYGCRDPEGYMWSVGTYDPHG